MSIKGPGDATGGMQLWPASVRAPDAKSHGIRAQAPAQEAPQAARTAANERPAAQPPEGVDPMLWSVLTTEERVFFSKFRSLGPLTYTPAARATGDVLPRGGRIDVTV